MGKVGKQQLKEDLQSAIFPYAVATGTANTYAIALNGVTAYTEGMTIKTKINIDASGVSTVNVNGLGAKTVKKANGTNVTNLKANGVYTLLYDGTSFILQGEGGSGNLQPSQALAGFTFTNDTGEQVGLGDADLIPSNILKGKDIFGVVGIETGWTTGTVNLNSTTPVTKVLGFQPTKIMGYFLDTGTGLWGSFEKTGAGSTFSYYNNINSSSTKIVIALTVDGFTIKTDVTSTNPVYFTALKF